MTPTPDETKGDDVKNTETNSLGDALPREMARVREVIAIYRSLPNGAGNIGAMLMEADLRKADQAVMSGDAVEMIRAYQKLKEIEL